MKKRQHPVKKNKMLTSRKNEQTESNWMFVVVLKKTKQEAVAEVTPSSRLSVLDFFLFCCFVFFFGRRSSGEGRKKTVISVVSPRKLRKFDARLVQEMGI